MTSARLHIRDAAKPPVELYGDTIPDFGPLSLKALRDHYVYKRNRSQTTANEAIGMVKQTCGHSRPVSR